MHVYMTCEDRMLSTCRIRHLGILLAVVTVGFIAVTYWWALPYFCYRDFETPPLSQYVKSISGDESWMTLAIPAAMLPAFQDKCVVYAPYTTWGWQEAYNVREATPEINPELRHRPIIDRSLAAMKRCVEGDLVLDIGANRGEWGALAAWHGCTTVQFEPQRGCHGYLANNIMENGWSDKLFVVPHPVSDVTTLVKIPAQGCSGVTSLESKARVYSRYRAWKENMVPSVVVSQVIPFVNGRIRFVHLDTEGHEVPVIRGMLKLLPQTDLVFVEVTPGWWEESIDTAMHMWRQLYDEGGKVCGYDINQLENHFRSLNPPGGDDLQDNLWIVRAADAEEMCKGVELRDGSFVR